MQIIRLDSKEKFNELKKGDILLVEWNETAIEYKKGHPVTHNAIWGINENSEVILNSRTNSYFDIELYLKGQSCAKEVYLVRAS